MSEREQLIAAMKLTLETSEEITVIKTKVHELEQNINERMTLDYGQQQVLSNAVKTRVHKLWDEGKINYEIHDTIKKLYSAIWRDLKNSFAVASYKDVRQKEFDEAISYIKGWRPRLI